MKECYWNIAGDITGTMVLETKPVENQIITINESRYLIVEVDYEENDEYYVVVENT